MQSNGTNISGIDQWLEAGTFFAVDGHKLFYRDSGPSDKPVVLLIHGFPTSSWDWYKLWPLLEEHYRLIALDMLGFGFSDKPRDHTYSIHQQADIVEDLICALEIDRFHVLAHDYGDTVAQELLYRQNTGKGKGHWLSVCLLNGGLFPETHRARLIQKLLEGPLGAYISRLFGKKQFERSFTAIFGTASRPSQTELNAFWELICRQHGNQILHKLIHYMADRRKNRERWLLALRDSCVPVMLINGNADPVSGSHMVARYRELVRPNDTIVDLPEIGHYPQVETPSAVASAYHSFVQEQS
ncbi:alpha/beta fold hydrolase [Litorivivens sp.]|uniref:alpha/beta fold hydrolase n=1 Tax=Litorivivens sp. TaxID=2020868 RepID=UPI0035665797